MGDKGIRRQEDFAWHLFRLGAVVFEIQAPADFEL